MKSSSSIAVSITPPSDSVGLSKGQKLFNKHIKQIDQLRQQLQSLRDFIPEYQAHHSKQYVPTFAAFNQSRIKLVTLLDQSYGLRAFTKAEREKIADLIVNIAGELLTLEDTPEVKEIFNRYNDFDFEEQEAEAKAMAKSMMEDMLGVPIEDDFDLRDPESVMRMMAEKAQAAQDQYHAEREAKSSPRKKTAKQLAKEAQMAENEKNASQSIREVYRKLASELHPDREPDESERRRKTDLMQRVNVAYDKQDLLALLELQLEIEQIDHHAIAAINEDRLKHYNQVLREQINELQLEIAATEFQFKMRFPNLESASMRPASLMRELKEHCADLKNATCLLENDLRSFEQPKALKAFLRSYRVAPPNPFEFDFDGF